MGPDQLTPAFTFKYLGVWFSGDGSRELGREERMIQAADRFRQMGSIWNNSELSEGLNIRLYKAGVYSVLACWRMAVNVGT